jgi:hypothetical protein
LVVFVFCWQKGLWILNVSLYLTCCPDGRLKHLFIYFSYAWTWYLLGLLGSVAPCVLYGSNVERLGSNPGAFAHHCMHYSGLYVIGNSCCGYNALAPWFSYSSRTAIRRRFNLEVCAIFFLCLSLCSDDMPWNLS